MRIKEQETHLIFHEHDDDDDDDDEFQNTGTFYLSKLWLSEIGQNTSHSRAADGKQNERSTQRLHRTAEYRIHSLVAEPKLSTPLE